MTARERARCVLERAGSFRPVVEGERMSFSVTALLDAIEEVLETLGEWGPVGGGRRVIAEVEGKPVVPYEHMTQKGKFVRPRARSYLAWKERFAGHVSEEMYFRGSEPLGRRPLGAEMRIVMPSGLHRQDLDNQQKALLDAAQGVAFPGPRGDQWFDRLTIERALGDEWYVLMVFEELR